MAAALSVDEQSQAPSEGGGGGGGGGGTPSPMNYVQSHEPLTGFPLFLTVGLLALGRTVVRGTPTPLATAYADRVICLADGKVVDELLDPDVEQVIDQMTKLR